MRGRKRVIENAKLTAFRIPIILLKDLKKIAKAQQISFGNLVRNALEDAHSNGYISETKQTRHQTGKIELKYVSVFLPGEVLKQSRHIALDNNISLGEYIRNILISYASIESFKSSIDAKLEYPKS